MTNNYLLNDFILLNNTCRKRYRGVNIETMTYPGHFCVILGHFGPKYVKIAKKNVF